MQQMTSQQAIVEMFNLYEFLLPKLDDFQQMIDGVALRQILSQMLDQQEESSTYQNEKIDAQNSLRNIKQIVSTLSDVLDRPTLMVDPVKIAQDHDLNELMILVRYVLLAITKSEKSQIMIAPMMSLPQMQQFQIAQIITELMQEGHSQNQDDYDNHEQNHQEQQLGVSETFLKKLEELEEQKRELESTIRTQKKEYVRDKSRLLEQIEELNRQEEQLNTEIKTRSEELNDVLERYNVQSLQELVQFVNSKEQDIQMLHQNIKDMSYEMKYMKENNDDIILTLRKDLDNQIKKNALLQKLERQIEQLNQDNQDDKRRWQEDQEKAHKGLKTQIEDLNLKITQAQEKLNKYKTQSKEDKTRICNLEFDLQKSRADQTSLTRQITLKEQEIYQLQNEINDLENALEQMRQEHQITQQLQEQKHSEGRNQALAQIVSPRRNLGFELSQVMNRSFHWEQNPAWQNSFKNDSRLNITDQNLRLNDSHLLPPEVLKSEQMDKPNPELTAENLLQSDAKSDDCSDDENLAEQVEFWKSKCEALLNEVNEKEAKYQAMKENSEHLESKLEKFFKEQQKYETELQNAKEALQRHFTVITAFQAQEQESLDSLQRINSQLSEERNTLAEKVSQLEQLQTEQLAKINQFEQNLKEHQKRREERKQKSKTQSVQILEKQLKITKRSYEETLEQKNEEIQLLLSIISDLVADDSPQQQNLLDKITQGFNMPFVLSLPK